MLRHLTLGLVIVVSALPLAACSDAEPSAQVATLDAPRESTATQPTGSDDAEAYVAKMREFVDCVRTHGYPEMQDPTELGGIAREDLLQLQGPEKGAIFEKCYPIIDGLPVPEEIEQQRLEEQVTSLTDEQKAANAAFSACMQKNGVPEYPDPQPNGLQAIEPWALPDTTVSRPPGLQQALDLCHKILDPSDPQ